MTLGQLVSKMHASINSMNHARPLPITVPKMVDRESSSGEHVSHAVVLEEVTPARRPHESDHDVSPVFTDRIKGVRFSMHLQRAT